MTNKRELQITLSKILTQTCMKKINVTSIQRILLDKRKMPMSISNEMLIGIRSIDTLTDEEMYWLVTALNEFRVHLEAGARYDSIILDRYFSNQEHTRYKNSEWKKKENNIYPIEFDNLIKVTDDQWVGVLSADRLLNLYNNQIINYNTSTQRNPIVQITANGVRVKPNLVKKSVEEIKGLMHKDLFIPNDISLNLNLDNDELEYEINENNIVLYNGQLDIIDGYHRFRGIILEKIENPNFTYNTVVNFMNFDEQKACRFIAQEDKRNKINKQYVRSLDATNPVHLVVSRLNEDSGSYLYGCIGQNRLLIDSSYLFALIEYSFKIKDRKDAMGVAKHLKAIFNDLIDNDSIKLEQIDEVTLAIIVRCASYSSNVLECINKINSALDKKDEFDQKRLERKRVNKPLMTYLDKMLLD